MPGAMIDADDKLSVEDAITILLARFPDDYDARVLGELQQAARRFERLCQTDMCQLMVSSCHRVRDILLAFRLYGFRRSRTYK
jgi:hypothetical protein